MLCLEYQNVENTVDAKCSAFSNSKFSHTFLRARFQKPVFAQKKETKVNIFNKFLYWSFFVVQKWEINS